MAGFCEAGLATAETTEAKPARPLSSTDGEVLPEIAEECEDAAQAGKSGSASQDLEDDAVGDCVIRG